ncbi:MAG: sigma-70 family RNA polymerase sigma factor [Planctomycetes bacterium]|nr:sigma-70 family RNA polymerase sigma factor [Planctomycetota bacterium]
MTRTTTNDASASRRADELDGSEPRDEALPILVDAEGARLLALGHRFCGNADDAEDLVQETFLQAYRKWERFEGRSRPSTWLYAIAANVCRRFHRRRVGEPARLESLDELSAFGEPSMGVVPADDQRPDARRLRVEAREQLERAVADLPVAFRMPFVLKEIVGFSVEDVAAVLGLKPNTVKTRLHRGRLRVRDAIEHVLPRRDVPAPIFSQQVCLDLLRAKQEALDRDLPFRFPDDVVCERCSEFFATLDLARTICHDVARGELPEALRRRLLDEVRDSRA